jgi:methylated-DNA-[protein]-cysteine S-methyltransferase
MRFNINSRIKKGLNALFDEKETAVIKTTKVELNEYFNKERTKFSIPLKMVGTNFQIEVWNELLRIPFGETESYRNLSINMNNQSAIRAIASANGANAIAILIPCHRVIGNDGKLVGYAGGLEVKKKLLELEGNVVAANQLKLF